MRKSVIPQVEVLEDGDTLRSPVVFIAEPRGLAIWKTGEREPVCRFTPFAILHPVYGQISKGHYLCRSKKVFDYLIDPEHGLDKSYRIVKQLPRETDREGNIVEPHYTDNGKKTLQQLTDDERLLYRQLVDMEARYFTKESGYTIFKGNVKSEETKAGIQRQMDNIKKTLNI